MDRVVGPVAVWALAAVIAAATLAEPVGRRGAAAAVAVLAGGWAFGVAATLMPPRWRGLLAVAAVVAVAVGAGAARMARMDAGRLVELARSGGSRPVEATVVAEPRPAPHGWWTDRKSVV